MSTFYWQFAFDPSLSFDDGLFDVMYFAEANAPHPFLRSRQYSVSYHPISCRFHDTCFLNPYPWGEPFSPLALRSRDPAWEAHVQTIRRTRLAPRYIICPGSLHEHGSYIRQMDDSWVIRLNQNFPPTHQLGVYNMWATQAGPILFDRAFFNIELQRRREESRFPRDI